ncbi:hypothetical protein Slin15195_G016870 [Septoria linicola]|uniref:Uncharacterized protein n=1 Tax=Septoria linicola TaxID=215465 RepID=A0A9Q9AK35_9PEZI|nr:hypothetical protein Slin15195_G016870 [Septoria linicola]
MSDKGRELASITRTWCQEWISEFLTWLENERRPVPCTRQFLVQSDTHNFDESADLCPPNTSVNFPVLSDTHNFDESASTTPVKFLVLSDTHNFDESASTTPVKFLVLSETHNFDESKTPVKFLVLSDTHNFDESKTPVKFLVLSDTHNFDESKTPVKFLVLSDTHNFDESKTPVNFLVLSDTHNFDESADLCPLKHPIPIEGAPSNSRIDCQVEGQHCLRHASNCHCAALSTRYHSVDAYSGDVRMEDYAFWQLP